MVTADRPTQLRVDIDAAMAAGDDVAARVMLERLWRERPGPATAAFVTSRAGQLPGEMQRRRATVAVLRSFTVEPVVPLLQAAAAVNGLDLTVHVGDFNSYGQEMLDPSRPVHAEWDPDVVIVAVQTRDVAPELWDLFGERTPDEIDKVCDQVVDQFAALVESFRRLNDATLVLHGFEEPSTTALGVADRRSARSQRAVIHRLNERIGALADEHRDVHVLDYDALVARAGRIGWHDDRKWQMMKMPIRAEHLVDLADEWLRFIQPAIGMVAKALVVDLDDTLWGGVLGEDGLDGIRVGNEGAGAGFLSLQRALLDIRSRGILLGVCSKNNPDEAMEALEHHPEVLLRPDKFASIRINWESKVDNLRSIAAELNIGLDSIAFMDDSAFECDHVRRALPEVTVIELASPPTTQANPISGHPLFERLKVGDEDRNRASYYAQQSQRRQAMAQTDSLDSYLHSLGTVVRISPASDRDVERVAQLTQKTNQFNVTTRRYTEIQVQHFRDDPSHRIFVARASDRFGDHGLIGVVIVETAPAAWSIDTMLLSCRVIGRGVETAMLAVVVDQGRGAGATEVHGTFVPTPKNVPASTFFASSGFDEVGSDASGTTHWRLRIADRAIDAPPWIELHFDEGAVR